MLPLYFGGRRYTLQRLVLRPGDSSHGRVLSRHEAEHLLASMMHDSSAATELRRLYSEIAYSPVIAHTSNDAILRSLTRELGDSFSGGGLVMLETEPARKHVARAEPEDIKEARRIDRMLAELGQEELVHRGHTYRVLRTARNADLPNRHRYEAVSDREAHSVLKEMSEETQRSERQRITLSELAVTFEKPHAQSAAKLLVLRHVRSYARVEEAGPPITPSQLRRFKEQSWLEVVLVDTDGFPVPAQNFAVDLPDARKQALITDGRGALRVDSIPSGDCRLLLAARKER